MPFPFKALLITAGVGVVGLIVAKKLYERLPENKEPELRNPYGRTCDSIPGTLNAAYTKWMKKNNLTGMGYGFAADESELSALCGLEGLEYLGKKKKKASSKAPAEKPPQWLCPENYVLIPGTKNCLPVGCGVE